MKRIIVTAAAILSGCAVAPERVAQVSDLEVCRSYGIFRASGLWATRAASYEAEVKRRGLIAADEWPLVEAKKIRNGMSRCAMYAAFGGPDRENRTVSGSHVHVQHVFNAGYRYIKAFYVYTDNDRVTAWQD